MSKTFIFIILFVLSSNLIGQITNIPDPKFEQALIDQGIDSDGVVNGQVFTVAIESLTNLDVSWSEIEDLTGIEDFINLTRLDVSQNRLISLDVSSLVYLENLNFGNPAFDVGIINNITNIDLSNNPELTWVTCSFNYDLTTINLSNNPNLERFFASNCSLSNFDVSNNPLLRILFLGNNIDEFPNDFSNLDLSNNPNLEQLGVNQINLEELNVQSGNNKVLTIFNATENPNLLCIQVDDEIAAVNGEPPYDSWNIAPNSSYSEDCLFGIEDALLKNNISLYPNPVEDIVHLRNDSFAEINQVSFYNMNGRAIHVKELKALTFDLSSLQSGVYFVKIIMDKGSLTKKVVKE